MTVTLKFQSSGTMPGDSRPVQMQGGSLTIGRGPDNDVVLPDPDRMLSKNHCVIEDHNGNVLVVDLSTNGTFLNYSKIPLGKIPTPLNNGDVLSVGTYELVIELGGELADLDDLIAAPAPAAQVSPGIAENAPDPLALLDDAGPGGDFLDDLLGGEDGPTGPSQLNPVDPIDELLPPMGEDEDPFFQQPDAGPEVTGASFGTHNPSMQDAFVAPAASSSQIPEDWDDLLGGGELAPQPVPAPPPMTPTPIPAPPDPAVRAKTPPILTDNGSQPLPEPTDPAGRAPPPPGPAGAATESPDPAGAATVSSGPTGAATESPGPKSAGGSEAARAFLKAVGAEDIKVRDEDLTNTMARMGRVMKTLITGLREILMTRTSIKSEFRIEQTMISAGGNNPLKFSINPEQAVEAMVRPTTKGYLSPETAAEQALNDIKAHEIAMVTGMAAALKGVLVKLNPDVLAGQIETSGALGSLLRGKKARYWEVYEKIYAEISDQAENDFHELFSREFARAYKDQLDKLK